jgi:hypothetical protein
MKRRNNFESPHKLRLFGEMDAVVKLALSRKRARLQHATSYTHAELQNWLCGALGARWNVHIPQTSLHSPAAAWPSSEQMQRVARSLRALAPRGCDVIDVLNGHCEQMALQLSKTAAASASSGEALDTLADTAQETLTIELQAGDSLETVARVFASQVSIGWHAGPRLWSAEAPNLCPAALSDISPDITAHTLAFVFGGEATWARIRAASTGEGTQICVLPMYVLCYIFDGDELHDAEMERSDEETAQYSVHCVGLMIDQTSKTVVVCVSFLSSTNFPSFLPSSKFPAFFNPSFRTQMEHSHLAGLWNSFAFRY